MSFLKLIKFTLHISIPFFIFKKLKKARYVCFNTPPPAIMSNTQQMDVDSQLQSAMRDTLSPLMQTDLFKQNPAFEQLFTQYISRVSEDSDLPIASSLVPIYAIRKGIWLPGIDVFTEENRSWYGLFCQVSQLETPSLVASEIPAALMYPAGTRIDIGLNCRDAQGDFTTITSAVILKSSKSCPLPLLQIKEQWEDQSGKKSLSLSSSKIGFDSPMGWFDSLENFSYGIIKVTVPDTRSYAERTRDKLQTALDQTEGTPFDKLLFLQEELKVSYSLRVKFSVRDDYHQACLKLREYKRQVYAFLHNMDLDDPEQIYAFARRGNIMKSLQMRVETKKWILERTPEAERCMTRPVNLRKNGAVGLWYEDPKNGLLCTMHASLRDKKIYYKPPVFPKVAELQTQLKKVYVTIRGGYLISLNL